MLFDVLILLLHILQSRPEQLVVVSFVGQLLLQVEFLVAQNLQLRKHLTDEAVLKLYFAFLVLLELCLVQDQVIGQDKVF